MIKEDHTRLLLQAAADGFDVPAAPTTEIIRSGRSRVRRRHAGLGLLALITLTVVGLGAPLVLSDSGSTSPAAGSGCDTVQAAVLPEWARTGFSDPEPVAPYVLGDRGDIVAILWGEPLNAPPAADVSNKILWVSRVPPSGVETLRIDAVLAGTDESTTREVPGGPGPSILNLPSAGCWHLTLHWGQQTDTLQLLVVTPRP